MLNVFKVFCTFSCWKKFFLSGHIRGSLLVTSIKPQRDYLDQEVERLMLNEVPFSGYVSIT